MSKKKKECKYNLNHACTEECQHYTENVECDYSYSVVKYKGKVIMGADNGYTGSMVFLSISDGRLTHIEPYPSAKRMYQALQDFEPRYAIIEQIFNAPGFRGVASSNFEVMGRYKQLFELLDIPYDCLRASSWRPKLGIKAKGRDAQKAASIAKAKELFSSEDFHKLTTIYNRRDKELHKLVAERWPDDNKCESALIAYVALQQYKSTLPKAD